MIMRRAQLNNNQEELENNENNPNNTIEGNSVINNNTVEANIDSLDACPPNNGDESKVNEHKESKKKYSKKKSQNKQQNILKPTVQSKPANPYQVYSSNISLKGQFGSSYKTPKSKISNPTSDIN